MRFSARTGEPRRCHGDAPDSRTTRHGASRAVDLVDRVERRHQGLRCSSVAWTPTSYTGGLAVTHESLKRGYIRLLIHNSLSNPAPPLVHPTIARPQIELGPVSRAVAISVQAQAREGVGDAAV